MNTAPFGILATTMALFLGLLSPLFSYRNVLAAEIKPGAFGADEQPPDDSERESPLMLRVYDVSNILLQAPDYRATRFDDLGDARPLFNEPRNSILNDQNNVMGQISGPLPASPDYMVRKPRYEQSQTAEQLVDLITSVVDPNDWQENGGSSTIAAIGDQLFIRTTKKTHQEIHAILTALRHSAAARPMVSIEVHWLWLTEKELTELVGEEKKANAHAVDHAAWKKLQTERANYETLYREGYHAMVQCLNGQVVSIVAGHQQRFVITVIPVVGDMFGDSNALLAPAPPVPSSGHVGHMPTTATLQEGAVLQVRPILCGKNEALLDFHSRVVEVIQTGRALPNARHAAPAHTATDAAAAVDRPEVDTRRLETTIRLPLDQRVLVGGVTGNPAEGDAGLYCFARVRVNPRKAR